MFRCVFDSVQFDFQFFDDGKNDDNCNDDNKENTNKGGETVTMGNNGTLAQQPQSRFAVSYDDDEDEL